MSAPIRVAILGFSAIERNALASYFVLAAKRSPSYVHVLDIDYARLVIADADQPGVAELLRELGRTGDAIFIGAHGPADAASWMMRPIDPMSVMRELDSQLAKRDDPQSGPMPLPLPLPPPSPPAPAQAVELQPPAQPTRADDRPAATPTITRAQRDAAQTRKHQREAALRPAPLRRALLVDDSEIALHFLDRHLGPYGLDTDYAHESDRALELLAHQSFGFVFVDVDLGDASPLDGLALCQRIKRLPQQGSAQRPVVIIVSAFHDPVDLVRGTLAGADAYLAKPLDAAVLDRLLQRHGLMRQAEPLPDTPPP